MSNNDHQLHSGLPVSNASIFLKTKKSHEIMYVSVLDNFFISLNFAVIRITYRFHRLFLEDGQKIIY